MHASYSRCLRVPIVATVGVTMQDIAESSDPVPQTILIVERHDRLRVELYEWLSAAFVESRCLAVRSGEHALEVAAVHPPEVALIDIGPPCIVGIETARQIKAIAPGTYIVIISIQEEPDYRTAAVLAGASAYICKQRIHNELVPIVRKLLS